MPLKKTQPQRRNINKQFHLVCSSSSWVCLVPALLFRFMYFILSSFFWWGVPFCVSLRIGSTSRAALSTRAEDGRPGLRGAAAEAGRPGGRRHAAGAEGTAEGAAWCLGCLGGGSRRVICGCGCHVLGGTPQKLRVCFWFPFEIMKGYPQTKTSMMGMGQN